MIFQNYSRKKKSHKNAPWYKSCHVTTCCSNQGNMFLRSPRETTLRNRLTDCPSCHFWIHHCFRVVFLGCAQSVTSTVWARLHTFSAQHSMLGSFCLAWWEVSQNCTAVWGSSHFIPPSCSFCVHQASSSSLCLGPLCQGCFSQNICWYLLFGSQTYSIYQAQPKFNK